MKGASSYVWKIGSGERSAKYAGLSRPAVNQRRVAAAEQGHARYVNAALLFIINSFYGIATDIGRKKL